MHFLEKCTKFSKKCKVYKNENLVHTKIEITKLHTFLHLSDQNGKTVIYNTIILIFILIKKNNRPFKPNINTFKICVHFFIKKRQHW